MSNLLNQADADEVVIKNLLRKVRQLTQEAQRKNMPLLQLKDNTIVRVHSFEVVQPEELEAIRLQSIDELAIMNSMLGITNNADGSVNADAPAGATLAPEASAETPAEAPAPVEQPAPVEAQAPTPAPEVAPAPAPETPAQPAADPAVPAAAPQPINLQ